MNILFLGNSLMFYNDLPDIFRTLATAGGQQVHVDSVTKGSATMADFVDETTEVGRRFREKLAERRWDMLIAEPSRRITPYEDSVMQVETDAAAQLRGIADGMGAVLVLYAVWGNDTGSCKVFTAQSPIRIAAGEPRPITRRAHTQFLHEVSHRIAASLGGVTVVEAGYAFENVLDETDAVELYHTDRRHPSPQGSYLAACTFYARLFGQRAQSLCDSFDCADKQLLRRIADATVFDALTPAAR